MLKKHITAGIFILITCLSCILSQPVQCAGYDYPLVVYGGEPEGVMAAVAAARNGTETLLVMKRQTPGGLITYGGLNYLDLNYGPEGRILGNGLFKEWHKRVGGGVTFPPELARKAFTEMLNREENITVMRDTYLLSVQNNGKQIGDLSLNNGGEEIVIRARKYIDASQDAELAHLAGVPCFTGGADRGLPDRIMAATLVLHLGNINESELKEDVISNKYGPSYMRNSHAWGFGRLGKMYRPRHNNVRLRGLNIVLQGESTRKEAYINALLIFNVEPTDKRSLAAAREKGKSEAEYILKYFRENLGGFSEARMLEFPAELYVRESRHVICDYQLAVGDLLHNRIFNDTIALGSYPLDYQAAEQNYDGFVLFNPQLYGIPLRSLIAKEKENLLVTGRSAGFSSLAAASARVLPIGMSTGEAAGTAAALSLEKQLSFRSISADKENIGILQKKLGIETAGIPSMNRIIEDRELLPYIEELLSWGLVIGGYDNNFRLDENIVETEFAWLLIKGLKRRRAPILYEWVPGGLFTLSEEKPLNRDRAAMLLLAATSHRLSEISREEYYTLAREKNLLPDFIINNVTTNRVLSRKEAFIIAGYFLQLYEIPEKMRFYRGELQ